TSSDAGDPQVSIVMGGCDSGAIGVKVSIPQNVRQAETMKILVGVWPEEQQNPAATASRGGKQRSIRKMPDPPNDSPGNAFGHVLPDDRSRLPVEQHHERFVNRPQRIGSLMQSTRSEVFAV